MVVDKKFNEDRVEWWQQKAVKRYNRLHEDDKLNSDTLWYDDLDTNTLKSWLSSRGIDNVYLRTITLRGNLKTYRGSSVY